MNCAIPAEKHDAFATAMAMAMAMAMGDGALRPNANCLRQIYAVTTRTK